MNTLSALISVVAVTIASNICVTFLVARNATLIKQHKVTQYCLIWLLPVLGALISALFLRSIRDTPARKSSHVPNDEDYPGVNMHPPGGDP